MKTSFKTALLSSIIALGAAGHANADLNSSTTKSVGTSRFGGVLNLSLTDSGNASEYSVTGNATAKAKYFGRTSTVGTGLAIATVKTDATGVLRGKMTVGGVILEDYTQNFTTSGTYNTETFTRTLSAGSDLFKIGNFVPVRLRGTISAAVSAKAEASIVPNGFGALAGLAVKAKVTPVFDISATASAALSSPVEIAGIRINSFSMGVDGTLRLMKASMPVSTKFYTQFVSQGAHLPALQVNKADYEVDLDLRSPSGSLSAFARASVFGQTFRYSSPIASFSASNFHFDIANGTVNFE